MTTAAAPTVACPWCAEDVPAGDFCGLCGGELTAASGTRRTRIRLRSKVFGAAPAERVLRPYFASSLFPELPSGSRRPFRITAILGAAALLASAVLRLPALGIAVGALGLPLMFLLYLRASGADRDLPRLPLVLAAVAGVLLGTGWVLVTGQVIARNYGVPMSVGLALHHLIKAGLLIPTIGMVLMMLPAVAIRVLRPGGRESLEGFVIGVLSALCFTAAATLTRLGPQLVTGLFAHVRPVGGLLVEAVLCGVTVPITAAAAGGMFGVALWFTGPTSRRVRPMLWMLAVAAALIHAAVGVMDLVGMSQVGMLVAHAALTVVVLMALRVVLQIALLHEAHDPVAPDQPLLCVHCEHVVPDMAFCAACGAATRASSRQSRRKRRGPLRPRRVDAGVGDLVSSGDGTTERVYAGMWLLPGAYESAVLRRPRLAWLLGRWGTAITATAVVLGTAALVLTPTVARYACPPECGKPPTGTPVMDLPRFESPDGAFSVSYPAPGSAYEVTFQDAGVTARYTGGDGGVLQLFSEPARGRSARDVVTAIRRRTYPEAKTAYVIPNAMVGYQPGYGEIADNWPQNAAATYTRDRILVLAAVKNDLALVAFATGPYHAFGPDFGPGPPSGANLEIAQDMGKYVNSFHWRGDPRR